MAQHEHLSAVLLLQAAHCNKRIEIRRRLPDAPHAPC